MVKKGYRAEKRRIEEMKEGGWIGFRVSGSVGAQDIIFIRKDPFTGELEIRIEQVKSTRKNKFYFDKQARSEWMRLRELSKRLGVQCFFVIYFTRNRKKKILKIEGDCPENITVS
ncbi:MAG: hypothetical protein DRJ32_02795 [Thermoprotei archaeon]|nr:MAG: hypothetical protein DRJ32_02795 [Thermoprotei archaeon]HDD63924.1 hypothetical protein [Thermoprotei archaeon]